MASTGGSSTSAYQYAATSRYRNDGDAGLSLVGCRYYDAQVGAFITRDTCLDQRPYAYCDADPVNATDPSGHGPIGNKITAIGNLLFQGGINLFHLGGVVAVIGIGVALIPGGEVPGATIFLAGDALAFGGGAMTLLGDGLRVVGPLLPF